jgi:hypothetical protein
MSDNIQNVCNWLDETEEDNLLYDSDDTDADPDFVCTNTHNEIDSESDTDVDVHINPSSSRINNASVASRSRSGSPLIRDNSSYYLGKDKVTKWYKESCTPSNSRTLRRNIVLHLPGVKRVARDAKSIIDCWKLFFPDMVIDEIVKCTNIYLTKIRTNFQRERDCLDTTREEIKALFGLLYLAGVLRSNHLNLKDLWSDDPLSPEYFRAVMPLKRFYLLLRALRFDDINTRTERKMYDKLAAIRMIFDGFVQRCQAVYTVGENCTIDEMLEAFRGRCSFRQYIPNKPNKYGIKIQALVDSRTFFTSNMEVYVGTQPDGPFKFENKPSSIVKRIITPITKTGRNITIDNWYTSIPLVNELLENHNLTTVGTLRKNKKEIPPCFLDTKRREKNSTLFGYSKNLMITSYVPRKNKNVILVSSMHNQGVIDTDSGDQNKPEIITFYNSTKGGVDVVDELKGEYSVSRVSCRWPLTIFFSLMNIAGINSQIIYRENTGNVITRRNYLRSLGRDLAKEFMINRLAIPTLSIQLRSTIMKITGIKKQPTQPEQHGSVKERLKCAYCPKNKNRKTMVSIT